MADVNEVERLAGEVRKRRKVQVKSNLIAVKSGADS